MTHWLAAFGSVFSFLACKGLLVFFGAMSALGVSMSLDGTVWMWLIVAGASIALVGFALNFLRHKNFVPLFLAAAGAGAVYYSYGVQYFDRVETAGLIALLVAAVIDYRSLRSRGSKSERIPA